MLLMSRAKNRLHTLQRIEIVKASFVVSQRPSESLDVDITTGSREESKQFLDNVSDFSTAPLTTQTHECGQRQAEEEESKAFGSLDHDKFHL